MSIVSLVLHNFISCFLCAYLRFFSLWSIEESLIRMRRGKISLLVKSLPNFPYLLYLFFHWLTPQMFAIAVPLGLSKARGQKPGLICGYQHLGCFPLFFQDLKKGTKLGVEQLGYEPVQKHGGCPTWWLYLLCYIGSFQKDFWWEW